MFLYKLDSAIIEETVIEEQLLPDETSGMSCGKEVSNEKCSFNLNFKKSEILNALAGPRSFFNTDFIRSKSIDLGSSASRHYKVSPNSFPLKAVLKKALQGLAPTKRSIMNRLGNSIDTNILNKSCNKLDIRSLDLAHVEIYSHKGNHLLCTSDRFFSHSSSGNESSKQAENLQKHTLQGVNQNVDNVTTQGRDSEPISLAGCRTRKESRDLTSTYYRTPKIIFVKNKFSSKQSSQVSFNETVSKANYCSCEVKDYTYHIIDEPEILSHPNSSDIASTKAKYPSEPYRRTQSVSHCLDLTRLSPPSIDPGPPRRHRHSISGQMGYFRMSGYGLVFPGQKRVGSASSLFSTAVISGSSSAPNLRDMIPNSASVTGKTHFKCCYLLVLVYYFYQMHNFYLRECWPQFESL